ncbi:hypothetical protein HN588_16230 [Candidatus Bathyarchaeota archaeon]|jgi:hypothetical protein|nr:hypothetical protein [Candidatus Bathyarchaeota archaeon]
MGPVEIPFQVRMMMKTWIGLWCGMVVLVVAGGCEGQTNGKLLVGTGERVEGEYITDVALMNPDGTGLTYLTHTPDPWNGVDVALSPDGRQLVYTIGRGSFIEIFVVNTDGTGLKNLTNNDDEIVHERPT